MGEVASDPEYFKKQFASDRGFTVEADGGNEYQFTHEGKFYSFKVDTQALAALSTIHRAIGIAISPLLERFP
jgi:hypothetical protein